MIQNRIINTKNNNIGYQLIIVLLMFLVGLQNSGPYLSYMGYSTFNKIMLVGFYILLGFMFVITVLNFLYKKKGIIFTHASFQYWLLLVIAVAFKFVVLFTQSPFSFMPGGSNFSYFLTHISNLVLMIVVIKNVHNDVCLKNVIWSFGIGAAFSAIIPLLFFPEMIGSRISSINNFMFSGAFWNSAVISLMSVGWLLIALFVSEKSKLKKVFSLGIFLLLAFASLSGLSRATLLSIIISVLIYLLFSKNFVRYIKTIGIITLLIIISIIYFQDVISNFEKRLDGGINISEESRVEIWKDYIEDVPDYFLLGEVSGDYKKYSITRHGPHSVVLNWITQFGLLGLLGFIMLLLGILKSIKLIKIKLSTDVAATLYAWLAAYLSIAMVNETGFKELSLYGGMGIILAWGKIVKRNEFK